MLLPLPDKMGKTNKVLTPLFYKVISQLSHHHANLLLYLCSVSRADNCVKYSIQLMRTYNGYYRKTVYEFHDRYSAIVDWDFIHTDSGPNISFTKTKSYFKDMTHSGILLPLSKPNQFIINPGLTYNPLFITAIQLQSIYNEYEQCNTVPEIQAMADRFRSIIVNRINETNKNKK